MTLTCRRRSAGFSASLELEAHSAGDRGWGGLTNGALVEAAQQAGFRCILTRDRLFSESATRALKRFPEFCVVLVTIPQLRGPEFLEQFRSAWARSFKPCPDSIPGVQLESKVGRRPGVARHVPGTGSTHNSPNPQNCGHRSCRALGAGERALRRSTKFRSTTQPKSRTETPETTVTRASQLLP